MRQGQPKRLRGRNRSGGNGGGGGGGQGGKGPNPLTRSYESNGPDVKIRGTAGTIADKYVQLSRDAHSSGDPVAAENYLQHAEHYYRLLAAAQAQYQPHQTFVRADADDFIDPADFDEEAEMNEANGQPPPVQPNGGFQPYAGQQPRHANGPRPNGGFGGGEQQPRRFDRNDRRPENRQDGRQENRQENRQDNRQDNRSDGRQQENRLEPRQEGRSERQDAPRPERHDRSERGERPAGADRNERVDEERLVGGLPAFITGGAPSAPAPATSFADGVSPPSQSAPESNALAASTPADGQPLVDPENEDGPRFPARGRRRRYGRYGRGAAGEEGEAQASDIPPPPADTPSE